MAGQHGLRFSRQHACKAPAPPPRFGSATPARCARAERLTPRPRMGMRAPTRLTGSANGGANATMFASFNTTPSQGFPQLSGGRDGAAHYAVLSPLNSWTPLLLPAPNVRSNSVSGSAFTGPSGEVFRAQGLPEDHQ